MTLPLPSSPGFTAALPEGEHLMWHRRSAPMRSSRVAFLVGWTALGMAVMVATGTEMTTILAFALMIAAGALLIRAIMQDEFALTNRRALLWTRGLGREAKFEAIPLADARIVTARDHATLHHPLGGKLRFLYLSRADRRWLATEIPLLAKAAS